MRVFRGNYVCELDMCESDVCGSEWVDQNGRIRTGESGVTQSEVCILRKRFIITDKRLRKLCSCKNTHCERPLNVKLNVVHYNRRLFILLELVFKITFS